jgi:hypothetical protein
MLQGSRSSTRAELTLKGTMSSAQPHCSLPNPNVATSMAPSKYAVPSDLLTKELTNVGWETLDSAIGCLLLLLHFQSIWRD